MNVEDITTTKEKIEVEEFLNKFGLKYTNIDNTIVIRDNGKIIATCSHQSNVLKCFAIDKDYQGLGLTSTLITTITQKLNEQQIYHNFIFTKPDNTHLFKSLGYSLICETNKVALLEIGNKSIAKSLQKLKRDYGLNKNYAAIVMNCNPFTLGHKYLIEQVSQANENVIVFIVEEDKSVFKFRDRIQLVQNGTAEFTNVTVVPASQYIISSATFPTYFLKNSDDVLQTYTELDCQIFAQHFASALNITKRYVGSEPNCPLTNAYNNMMQQILPKYGVEVTIVERKQIDAKPISASLVREMLEHKQLETLKNLVPSNTYQFLQHIISA